jgi:hypothetical protein
LCGDQPDLADAHVCGRSGSRCLVCVRNAHSRQRTLEEIAAVCELLLADRVELKTAIRRVRHYRYR